MKIATKPKIKREGNLWKCYCDVKFAYGYTPNMAYVNWRNGMCING